MKSPRLQYIDIAKGIGILLVIIGHSISIHSITSTIYSFHMPLFFILSGFFLKKEEKLKSAITKGFRTLICPYIFTGIIITIVATYYNHDIIRNLLEFILVDCKISNFQISNIGAIWFLVCLYISRIIALLSLKNKYGIPILLVLVIVSYSISHYKEIQLPFCLLEAPVTTLFVLTGYYLNKYKYFDVNIENFKLLSLFLFFFYFARYVPIATRINLYHQGMINIITASFLSYIFVLFCRMLERHKNIIINKTNNLLSYCGKYSLIILCSHSIESHFHFFYFESIPSLIATFLNTVIIIFISLIVIRVPILRQIFSK